ncbi:Crp/Fnr family transcriptional regulator [Treponema sp.]|uniref:Crp/Fnr family transcriptional regulator n=1 Tax=Treponema sp. TaxID=166 RepID=UPI0025D9DCF9|nr:Crp/Fnr family transcriptional regulator [Treponema sp.]MCR5218950.1 Crp/Fnr family transcriptional regulator [Treponema sp.]
MNYTFLKISPLFKGYTEGQIKEVVEYLGCRTVKYKKGSFIYHAGSKVTEMGLVLKGSVQMEAVDLLGNRSILGIAMFGDIFAESYACIPEQPLMVDVAAREAVEVLFINIQKLISDKNKKINTQGLVQNILQIAARKNLGLSMRIFHSSPKKIRDRLISYFSAQVRLEGDTEIEIPLDRQQLADYLGVDRTALSKELGKMKKDGLIDYRKNHFSLYL